MKHRTACCSFCEKSFTEVGPLVEGPGHVYICGECIELSQSIIEQERRRRNPPAASQAIEPEVVQSELDRLVAGQQEAKAALATLAACPDERPRRVLLIGPSRASGMLLARALAHVLDVPFASGDSSGLVKPAGNSAVPLLYQLLSAADFDNAAAQRGVIYLDSVDRSEAQQAVLRVWQRDIVEVVGTLQLDLRRVLFVCGGRFTGIDEAIVRLGRHREQPVTGDALIAAGALPAFVSSVAVIARAAPLDDDALTRLISCVDFSRAGEGTT